MRGEGEPPGPLAWLSARQRDLCLYCGCETWLPWQRRRETKLREAWNMPASRSMACQLAFDCRMASIEHLCRRADGGDDKPGNLAMACAFCNSSRHERAPGEHAAMMRALRDGGRHPCHPVAAPASAAPELAAPASSATVPTATASRTPCGRTGAS